MSNPTTPPTSPAQDPAAAPAVVIQRGGMTIKTRYYSPTNHRGSRIKAWNTNPRPDGKFETVWVSYDYSANCPHEIAFRKWVDVFSSHYYPSVIQGDFIKGSCQAGFTFTRLFSKA